MKPQENRGPRIQEVSGFRVAQTKYRDYPGDWFNAPTKFPAMLFDPDGYILINNRKKLNQLVAAGDFNITGTTTKKLTVCRKRFSGIADMVDYVPLSILPKEIEAAIRQSSRSFLANAEERAFKERVEQSKAERRLRALRCSRPMPFPIKAQSTPSQYGLTQP